MSDKQLFNARVRWASFGLMTVVFALVSIGVLQVCWAEITPPMAKERGIAQAVVSLMRNQHLLQHPMDDEISRRGFKLFIDGLDPLKCYFYQSDIDAFKQYEDQLDDRLSRGDIDFAHSVFKLFLARVEERVVQIDELLKQDFDFTLDEAMETDSDELHFPVDEAEARQRWKKRIKYDLLLLKAEKADLKKSDETEEGSATEAEAETDDLATADAEARAKLSKRYHNFSRRMNQLDNDELLEMFLTAMTMSYDPHTTYMSPSALENFSIQMRLNLEGIGAQLQDKDGTTIVADIVPGGAADKHGKLKKDDQIISVGQGEEGEMEDIVGMKLNDVVSRIRGDKGTIVRLGVIPGGKKEVVTYKITRAKIELEDSAAHGEIFEVGDQSAGAPLKVGVIDLPSFYQDGEGRRQGSSDYRSATHDVNRILDNFKSQGVGAVVLDLRRNGGGFLDEAIDLTGLFIDRGPVVQVGDERRGTETKNDDNPGMAWDGPLVVVTSKLSASASEILAGAVQDYRRGLVIGDATTHGKGTVQTLLEVGRLVRRVNPPDLGVLKITVQQFFRPNGDSTQKQGVLADVLLPSVTNSMDIGEADLDFAIDFKHINPSNFTATQMVSGPIVTDLQQRSAERVDNSEDFAKLLKRIDAYEQRKDRKSVTLNEKKFFEEGDELNGDDEEEERLVEELRDKKKIKRDYYMDEVLAITRDYVDALRKSNLARVN